METFNFNYYNDSGGLDRSRNVTVNITGSYSPEVIMREFETFLNACGYQRGEVQSPYKDIVPDTMATTQYDEADEKTAEILSAYEALFDAQMTAVPPVTVEQKLKESIIPFLENLKKDPDKVLMRWPNRQAVVENKIEEILNILGENHAS
jgi:hypothetical protein